ncbi:hypothetical protein GDO86_009566, partial [Hymenochirus boettgeri]
MFGYRTECCRQALCYLGYLLSLGFLKILFNWKPELHVLCSCIPCSLEEADIILLKTTIRYIQVQKIRFVWNAANCKFQKVGVLEDSMSCSDIHRKFCSGLSREEREIEQEICGFNSCEVEIVPIWKLLFKEILNPFYFCEAYSIIVWISLGFLNFSLVLIGLTVLSLMVFVYMLRKQSIKLNRMVSAHNNVMVTLLNKNGVMEEIPSRYLVPGDVIILTRADAYLPCDAILISGGCVTDEGMLTGESVPVTKTPLPFVDNDVPWKIHTGENYIGHVLYCGTKVIRIKPATDGLVKAVVLQTGFNTTKGDLVRSILYPKPVKFKLYKDVFYAILICTGLAITGIAYIVVLNAINGAAVRNIVRMILIKLSGAVPVTLPPSLTIVTLFSQRRLKKEGIFCISPPRITLCGQINLVCFDKTGTLTEDGLDLWGILPSKQNCFQDIYNFRPGISLPWGPLLGAMASCHSLVVSDGKLCGDPLDLKMFQGLGWELEDCKGNWRADEKSCSDVIVKPGAKAQPVPVKGITILRQFPFSSVLQRMSVITHVVDEQRLTVFMKGAPEKVVSFCNIETVPSDFENTLSYYTAQGFRVIGLAYKYFIPKVHSVIEKLEREEVESDLVFLGFLILENQLKPESKSVIQELTNANIRTVMITGDNLQTACTVGITSGLVPDNANLFIIEAKSPRANGSASITWNLMESNQQHKTALKIGSIINEVSQDNNTASDRYYYAMSGETLQTIKQHFPCMVSDILLNGVIFARMAPKQKASLVEDYQKIDYYVAMCGDGANDCGALKMAHAGISLSELEASVSSPFTSKTANISCVPKLLKEGRNAFVASVGLFKVLVGIVLVSTVNMLLLFPKGTLFGNPQYIFQGMAVLLPIMVTMSLNGPAKKLAPYRPAGNLMSPSLLPSLAVHILLSFVLQISMFLELQKQPWFSDTDVFSGCISQNQSSFNQTIQREPSVTINFYSTSFFPIVGINFITIQFVFSKARPFRQLLYKN